MKKFMCIAAMSLFVMASFTSCSDDDEPKQEINIPSGVYSDSQGLTLTVNGEPMIGKTAEFTPNASDPSKATITLKSTFDLASIPNVPGSLATLNFEGPGVIPGSPVTVLKVDLVEVKGDAAKFSGKDENEYCTFEYNGSVSDSSIEINFTNVTLKDLSLAGFYRLLPYNVNEDFESDEYGTVYSEPVYVKWESTADFDFLGTAMKPADLIKLLMTMPLLDDMSVRIPDMLYTLLQDVRFEDNGNIIANYLDTNSESETPTYRLSPANMAQYVVTGKNSLRFWLNPQAVMKDATRAGTSIDLNNLFGNVIAQVAPMLKEGVPMRYTVNGTNTTIYLATETILPLLKQNVVPLLRNQDVVNRLVELVKADESMAGFAEIIPGMLTSAADMIDGTTTLEVGLNLTTATN